MVVGSERRPIDASSLSATVRSVETGVGERIRRLAERRGYLVEHKHGARYGIGVAVRLVASDGFAEGTQARDSLRQLSTIPGATAANLVAFSSLPFSARHRGELIVPTVTLVNNGTDESVICVSGDREFDLERFFDTLDDSPPPQSPDQFDVGFSETRDDYLRRVTEAKVAIASGGFEKVVLARKCVVRANAPYRIEPLVSTLRTEQPNTALFAVDGFIGASPELLVERRGAKVTSTPLAGTVPRSDDQIENAGWIAELTSSEKERFEHRVVVEEIEKILTACGANLEAPNAPEPLELANVTHLATLITGTLDGADSWRPSALELACALHPTPAIAGSPRESALGYLARTEPFDRGRYGGPVGYVDANGDGAWWIGIRAATITGEEAVLCAGGGIVAGSDPEAEFAETVAKFAALLPLLTRS